MSTDHATDMAKASVDMISLGLLAGTLVDILPAIAAVFTIVWTAIRISETNTVQTWLRRSPKDSTSAE